jgi:response regulator NasT
MHNFSVLIADDDAVIRMDLRALLEDMGHAVVAETDNGEDACHLARSLKPSVAILDVVMPRLNGLRAAAVISEERICPVVMLTAYSEAPMIEEATKAGVLAYLVKPYRREEIASALHIAQARFRELLAIESDRDALADQIETDRLCRQARLILMRRHAINEREAGRRMQAQAVASGKSLKSVAEAILLTQDIAP